MKITEVYEHVGSAWQVLSKKRGYAVEKDSPVCIFITSLIAERSFALNRVIIPIPKANDFQAVLIGEIDGVRCLIDPDHLTWRKKKSKQEPSLEEATLIVPIYREFDASLHIPNADQLDPEYIDAISSYIHEAANHYVNNTSLSLGGRD